MSGSLSNYCKIWDKNSSKISFICLNWSLFPWIQQLLHIDDDDDDGDDDDDEYLHVPKVESRWCLDNLVGSYKMIDRVDTFDDSQCFWWCWYFRWFSIGCFRWWSRGCFWWWWCWWRTWPACWRFWAACASPEAWNILQVQHYSKSSSTLLENFASSTLLENFASSTLLEIFFNITGTFQRKNEPELLWLLPPLPLQPRLPLRAVLGVF